MYVLDNSCSPATAAPLAAYPSMCIGWPAAASLTTALKHTTYIASKSLHVQKIVKAKVRLSTEINLLKYMPVAKPYWTLKRS